MARIILAAAAKHLTPVVLELGGKCPVVVDTNINLQVKIFYLSDIYQNMQTFFFCIITKLFLHFIGHGKADNFRQVGMQQWTNLCFC